MAICRKEKKKKKKSTPLLMQNLNVSVLTHVLSDPLLERTFENVCLLPNHLLRRLLLLKLPDVLPSV
jgi:hypothetical protein